MTPEHFKGLRDATKITITNTHLLGESPKVKANNEAALTVTNVDNESSSIEPQSDL